jgi:S1-C subfamily serine protease
MLGRLKQSHFAIIPEMVYAVVDDDGEGPGTSGIDTRVLDGHAVVTSVDPGSPAALQGVRPGWQIESAGGKPMKAVIAQALSNPAIHDLQLTRAVLARLSGPIGGTLEATFLDASNKTVTRLSEICPPSTSGSKTSVWERRPMSASTCSWIFRASWPVSSRPSTTARSAMD